MKDNRGTGNGERGTIRASLPLSGRCRSRFPIRDSRCAIRDSSAFTLLEVLVALAVLATAVTVILQLFSASLRNVSLSEEQLATVATAESRLAELLGDEALSEAAWQEVGKDGSRTDIAVRDASAEAARNLPLKLFEVAITVHWKAGPREKSMILRSMKLVPKTI